MIIAQLVINFFTKNRSGIGVATAALRGSCVVMSEVAPCGEVVNKGYRNQVRCADICFCVLFFNTAQRFLQKISYQIAQL